MFQVPAAGAFPGKCALLNCVSEENRVIPNESADPEQYDRDKRIDLQNVVRQLGRDRAVEKKWGQISTFDISLGGGLTVARWAQPHHPKIDNVYPRFANSRSPRTERTVRVKLP